VLSGDGTKKGITQMSIEETKKKRTKAPRSSRPLEHDVRLFAPIDFETFRRIGSYDETTMKRDEPSCFNSEVSILKYRVRVELIDEPVETYRERLQKLWNEEDNHHHYEPLQNMAKRFGVKLVGDFGSKRRKST
jgi:hypothetical protein